MHAFLQNAISFALLYSGCVNQYLISKLYIYKNSTVYLSDYRVKFFCFFIIIIIYFLHDTRIEKPDYTPI